MNNNWDQYQSTPKLLPPTVFEKTSDSLPSQSSLNDEYFHPTDSQISLFTNELDKLKLEIKKLHSENESLRHKNKDFVEQAQLYTEVSEHRKISITALEDVILKQTKEIQNLKSELNTERESSSQRVLNIEQKHNDKILELTERLNEANRTLKQNQVDFDLKIKTLEDEKREISKTYEIEISNLKKVNDENEKCLADKDATIKNLRFENDKITLELNNLKLYVENSNVHEIAKERKVYEDDINKLKTKLELVKQENSSLQIRLKSINEILSIQENQLESSVHSNDKKRTGLLNKWRLKVYELLVQLKSQEINFKQEKSLDEKEILNFKQVLSEQSGKNRILENVIEDKKAELSVLTSDVTSLNEQISILKDRNETLEQQCKKDLESSIELKKFVDEILKNYNLIEESFRQASKKLNHLDQRVEFAKNRLGVIKALYTSKRELKRGNVLDMTTNLSSIHPVEHVSHVQEDKESLDFIRQELNRVVDERDLLACKLQTDVESMNVKLNKMKDEYELVIGTLNSEIKELRVLNDEKDDKLDHASRQLLEKGALYDELKTKYEELDERFKQLKNELSIDNDKSVRERESQFMEKLAQMNEKLNEARREQAKAVVLMRQMERSTNREKERMENLLKSCDSYYKEHVKNLQDKIVSLEKEKNILMGSLRQQGGFFNRGQEVEHEVTSFWMDTRQEIEDEEKQSETSRVQANKIISKIFDTDEEEEQQVDDELNNSDMNKNTEILQQIRNIMGNLELSDVDDDDDDEVNDSQEDFERRQKYAHKDTEETEVEDQTIDDKKEQNGDYNDEVIYRYDIEHVIDDLINKRQNNSSF